MATPAAGQYSWLDIWDREWTASGPQPLHFTAGRSGTEVSRRRRWAGQKRGVRCDDCPLESGGQRDCEAITRGVAPNPRHCGISFRNQPGRAIFRCPTLPDSGGELRPSRMNLFSTSQAAASGPCNATSMLIASSPHETDSHCNYWYRLYAVSYTHLTLPTSDLV